MPGRIQTFDRCKEAEPPGAQIQLKDRFFVKKCSLFSVYGYGVWSAQTRRLLENCFFHRRGVNPELSGRPSGT